MKHWDSSVVVILLVSYCAFISAQRDGHYFHQHSGTELDSVQCHHNVHKTKPANSAPELVQETRLEPSRQYLPQQDPFKPRDEEAPAASFEQPNVLPVEKTLVSPSVQNNYRSLFGDKNKPDSLSLSAAQNVPSNALPPPAPRISSDKKHSHHDDEDNLERLCNDAFHSFLCKPIKGPRKTPTGRLRPNAVVPPAVLAELSSNQAISRVRPDDSELPSPTNNVGQAYLPPPQQPTNKIPQGLPFPKPTSTTTRKPPTQYLPPAPFVNILKEDNELPSPSNTNSQVFKPQPFKPIPNTISTLPPHDCEKTRIHTASIEANPSNENPIVRPYSTSTPKPFSNFFNTQPSTPFPINTYPKIAQPLRTIAPPHDCEKSKNIAPYVANPSNDNPTVIKTYNPPTPKPFTNFYIKPTTSPFKFNFPSVSQYSSTLTPHNCDKTTAKPISFIANPSNYNPSVVKPFNVPTPKPFSYSYNYKPTTIYVNNNIPKSTAFPQFRYEAPRSDHDCNKHKQPFLASNTNQSPYFAKPQSTSKPYTQFTFKPFSTTTSTESPKVPLPSNNIAQIVAQPQQINTVTVSPKASSGYYYEKPSVPFPPPEGFPSEQNPSVTEIPTTTGGYRYDQPRIPFPSNNVPQRVPQPVELKTLPPFKFPTTTTAKPKVPCKHDKDPAGDLGNPTNEDLVVVKPNSGYSYDKPAVPFPPERGGSSNEIPVTVRPFVPSTPSSTTGYYYDKPSNPLVLPNPAINYRSFLPSPSNNGYNYQKPDKTSTFQQNIQSKPQPTSGYSYQQPSVSFPTSINSKLDENDNQQNLVGRAQTQVEVTARPGYSYDKPDNPLLTPQSSSQNEYEEGYSYPKPAEENFDVRSNL